MAVSGEPAVVIKEVSLRFGGVRALDDVSFDIPTGGVYGIVGPNGAGKTALLNCISGIYRPKPGSVKVFGTEVVRMAPHKIMRLGVGRTFQAVEHFREALVVDYVLLGRLHMLPCSVTGSIALWPFRQRAERRERGVVMGHLERMGLAAFATSRLGDLPYGIQKRVDIARAVVSEPALMLVDEPTSGTTTSEREEVSGTIDLAAGRGITLVIIDHDVSFVRRHCERIVVMNAGHPLGTGPADEVLALPEVVEAFLGSSKTRRAGAHRPAPANSPETAGVERSSVGGSEGVSLG